jgi:hypothetical protein
MQEKPPGQILSLFGGVTTAAHVRIEWIPVDFLKLADRSLETGCPTLGREQLHAPPSRMKPILIVPRARYGSASIVNTPADAGIDSSDRAEEREFAVVKAEIRYQQVMGTPAGITQNDPSDQFRRQ